MWKKPCDKILSLRDSTLRCFTKGELRKQPFRGSNRQYGCESVWPISAMLFCIYCGSTCKKALQDQMYHWRSRYMGTRVRKITDGSCNLPDWLPGVLNSDRIYRSRTDSRGDSRIIVEDRHTTEICVKVQVKDMTGAFKQESILQTLETAAVGNFCSSGNQSLTG